MCCFFVGQFFAKLFVLLYAILTYVLHCTAAGFCCLQLYELLLGLFMNCGRDLRKLNVRPVQFFVFDPTLLDHGSKVSALLLKSRPLSLKLIESSVIACDLTFEMS